MKKTKNKVMDLDKLYYDDLIDCLVVGLVAGLVAGLVGGLVGGLVAGLVAGLVGGLVAGLVDGLVGGLVAGLVAGLVGGLVGGLTIITTTQTIALIQNNPEYSMITLIISTTLLLIIQTIGWITIKKYW